MMRLVQRGLFHNTRAFLPACSECKLFQSFGAPLAATVPSCQFTSVKQPAKRRRQLNVQPSQGSRRPVPRLSDPIRPVSDKLLLSLMRRHKEKFAVLGADKGSMSLTMPVSPTEDLIHAIYSVPKDAANKTDQLTDIEKLLTKRLLKMTLEEALQACHGFYLQEHKFHKFLSHMLSVMDERFDDLCPSDSEVTRLLFYVFIQGSAPSMLLHKVEDYLLRNLDEFDINDLGVICVGFFRANTRLSSQDLLDALAKKLLTDMSSLELPLLLDFVRTFRHASYIKVSFYEQLADYLIDSKSISMYTTLNPIMHMAFTYASIPVQHTALFEHLFSHAEKLLSKQRFIRTKDISKFVWACGTLQFRPENYEKRYNRFVEVFEASIKDNREFPESIAEMLMGLVYLGIFPQGLLHRCFSYDVATRLLASGTDREKSFQLLLLNETVKTECPDYTGNLMSKSQVEVLRRHPSASRDLDTEMQTRVGLLAVLSCLQRSLGEDRVRCAHPFLHFRTAVIELCHSEEHGFVEVSSPASNPQMFSSDQTADTFTQKAISGDIFSALTRNSLKTSKPECLLPKCTRLAVVVTSSSQFALNDQQRPLGHLHTMTRQLSKADYTVIQILPDDAQWLELSSHKDRCRHLSAVLSSALQASICLS
ncbi:FAST kinase domain-containing protein 5, mitochondrial-like isoform X2 [Babylonia areolata]